MKIVVIGAGYGGLSAASYLGKAGHDVVVLEKNAQAGGRAMIARARGEGRGVRRGDFTFDLGPSWYLMPDLFTEFFADFGHKPTDFFELKRLNPGYQVITGKQTVVMDSAPKVFETFNDIHAGDGDGLKQLLAKTKQEYETVRAGLLDSPMNRLRDVLNLPTFKMLASAERLGSYHRRIIKYVKDPELQKILEFMVVFMGGSPGNIPALYTLLSHIDLDLGVYYPIGGFSELTKAYLAIAREQGVRIKLNQEVNRIIVQDGQVTGVETSNGVIKCDAVVAGADYHHVETALLDSKVSTYPEKYWQKRTLSPSGLLIHLGVRRQLPKLMHHNLFFDTDWDGHFREVFKTKTWSENPLFYVSVPSKTDKTVAPVGMENIFILAPMAAGDQASPEQIKRTIDNIISRLEKFVGEKFRDDIVVRQVRAHDYFKQTFNAYQGNSFGLAHTLTQSALLRPRMQSKKVHGLYYTGQYTNPGTGVPMVTLSGKVVAKLIRKNSF